MSRIRALLPLCLLALGASAVADDAAADQLGRRALDLWRKGKKPAAVKVAERAMDAGRSADALEVIVMHDFELWELVSRMQSTDATQASRLDGLSASARATMERHADELAALRPGSMIVSIVRQLRAGPIAQLLAGEEPACSPEAAAHFERAELAYRGRRGAEALAAYDAGLALCPDAPTWWTYSGDAELMQGHEREALDRYAKAIELDLCASVAHRFTADVLVRPSDLTGDDLARALAHSTLSIACTPVYEPGWTTLGAIASAMGQKVVRSDWARDDAEGLAALHAREATFAGLTPWYARQRAAEELLAEGGPLVERPLFQVFDAAKRRGLLQAAVAFETLDVAIAPEYAQLRYLLGENLAEWVLTQHVVAP